MMEALLFVGAIFIKPFQTLAYHAIMLFALCVCVSVSECICIQVRFKSWTDVFRVQCINVGSQIALPEDLRNCYTVADDDNMMIACLLLNSVIFRL